MTLKVSGTMPNNPLDDNAQGLIGRGMDRVEGPLKVTGCATYAYEYNEGGKPAYGFIVTSTISKGRIRAIDSRVAEAMPGVLWVMTHKNTEWEAPKVPASRGPSPRLKSDRIDHYFQPVAMVVAESFEIARAAARLVKVDYDIASNGKYKLHEAMPDAKKPPPSMWSADTEKGDFDAAFAAAPVKIDATYTTPHQSHAMMEPHATLAVWDGDRLTLYTANQLVSDAKTSMAATLLMLPKNIRIISRYIGGGFGGKLNIEADAVLAAMAARKLNRPVKVALTRQQVFHATPHRTETSQHIRLGATTGGQLTAIAHEAWSANMEGKGFWEPAALQTRQLYAAPNRITRHRLATLDLPEAASMRAPGEAVGMLALEIAMDELAEKLQMDPVKLRLVNDTQRDPEKDIPFSSRKLAECLEEGAKQFGWDKRKPQVGAVRDGEWLLGLGMASAFRGNLLQKASASVRLDSRGVLTAKQAMTDIGTGSYTILAQIAAETLGLPTDKIIVEMGDSDMPHSPGSGGSWGAASAGSALYDACMQLREVLGKKAGIDAKTATFANGQITSNGRQATLASLAGLDGIEAEGTVEPGDNKKDYAQASFGAHFAEVAVNAYTGEIRLRRMLGVFAAGRILNEKTATSQAIGGMIFGIGAALGEELQLDTRDGTFVNHDLAEYHVPVHADVPAIEAIYLPELDDKSNPLRAKGVGELGISGAGAAIANAVYNACGARIRNYPLTLDKVLEHMTVGI